MITDLKEVDATGWSCAKCGEALQKMPVKISYMTSVFEVALPRCPKCGYTFVPPDLALGKMLEVEKILEDK